MTPLRLIILAVLFYIAWRLIKSGLKKKFPGLRTEVVKDYGQDSKAEDVLVEDPVCHKLVPQKQAIRLRHQGKYLYFCSERCCDTFSGEPGGEL